MEMALEVGNCLVFFLHSVNWKFRTERFLKRAFISACLHSRVLSKGPDLLTVNISRHGYMEKTLMTTSDILPGNLLPNYLLFA